MDDLRDFAADLAETCSAITGHTDKDWAVLSQTRGLTTKWAARIAAEFIASLSENPVTAPLLGRGRELREANLATWFESLLSGTPGRSFWTDCTLVGLAHAAAGVPSGLVVAGGRHVEEVFLAHCMGAFEPTEALRVHAAFGRVVATAIAVMTSSAEEVSRACIGEMGIEPSRFQQHLRFAIHGRLRAERAKLRPLDWGPELSVGVTSLDEQHQELFALLNEFHQASTDERDAALMREIVGELLDYTKIHFAYEETLLAKHGYPDLEPHRAAHGRLAAQVHQYADAAHGAKTPLTAELYFFLRTWLNGHIRGSDRRYGAHLNERGVH